MHDLRRPNVLAAALRKLRPGDVVFSMHMSGKAMGKVIADEQRRKGYPQHCCRATHVALYVGGGEIIHAVRPKVVRCALVDYFTAPGTVLTTWDPPEGATWSRDDLARRLCAAAAAQVGKPYETARLIEFLAAERITGQTDLTPPRVCSTFVRDLFLDQPEGEAIMGRPRAFPGGLPTPAFLFAQTALRDL